MYVARNTGNFAVEIYHYVFPHPVKFNLFIECVKFREDLIIEDGIIL